MPGELLVFQIMPLSKENSRPISRILSSETETNYRGMGGERWRTKIPGEFQVFQAMPLSFLLKQKQLTDRLNNENTIGLLYNYYRKDFSVRFFKIHHFWEFCSFHARTKISNPVNFSDPLKFIKKFSDPLWKSSTPTSHPSISRP